MTKLQEIIREVHRRSLWQVLTIYLVGAWIGYEVILSLTEGMGLPEWVPVFAIVLFIIGLPIVLATAFVQEGLPGDAPEPATDVPAPATAGGPRLTWTRSIALGIAAFLLLAGVSGSYMWMRSAGVGPMGSLVGQGELDAGEPLVVAEFTSPSGDNVLARVLTSAFRTDLSQSSLIRPADRGQVDAALRLMERPSSSRLDPELAHEVAARLGLRAVVVGEVGRAGGGYALNARIESADSARVLAAFQAIASDSTELLDAIQELSRSVRERAGESLRTLRASYPLSQVTTASLPALRKYTEAHRMEYEVGDRARASRLLDEALELDPGFAMAYFLQAIIAYNREEGNEALRAIEAARSHEDRLTAWERHSVRQLGAAIRGDYRQSEHELRDRWRSAPPTRPRGSA